jgi:hypothetical protein
VIRPESALSGNVRRFRTNASSDFFSGAASCVFHGRAGEQFRRPELQGSPFFLDVAIAVVDRFDAANPMAEHALDHDLIDAQGVRCRANASGRNDVMLPKSPLRSLLSSFVPPPQPRCGALKGVEQSALFCVSKSASLTCVIDALSWSVTLLSWNAGTGQMSQTAVKVLRRDLREMTAQLALIDPNKVPQSEWDLLLNALNDLEKLIVRMEAKGVGALYG